MKKVLILITLLFFISGCTDATKAGLLSYGKNHKITLFSGGQEVKSWISTGKVTTLTHSDGWEFMDQETKKLVRVGGNVVIEVID